MPILTLFTFNIIKILLLAAISAAIAFVFAPFLIRFLNKIGFWKKEARQKTITGEEAGVFYSLHKEKETAVPRAGGLLVWLSITFLIFLFFGLSFLKEPWWLKNFNFLSRKETWLPLFTLISASLVGLIDDILVVYGKGKYVAKGMTFKRRLIMVTLIGLVGGLWFYYKLGWNSIHIPLVSNFPFGIDWTVGWWIIPIFIFVMIASWSGGVIDGLDGLSGGVFTSIFGALLIIAFSQGKIELATFCAVILGTLFAFLWFNIPPARFYMGETGILGLTSTMAVVAFLTDSVLVLPIIAGLLVLEVGSIILQLLSKKFRHKKIWLSTPIHHHFEAKGWPPYKVTMRFWIVGTVLAILGTAIKLLGQ
jgi:phospho-N-acetylmuramoyl-pentapeptide-transferase